jgi:hypothetical protein
VKHEGGGQINWYYRDVLYTRIDSILWMKGAYRILIDRGYVYGMDVCHLAFGRGYFEPPNRYNALPGRFYKVVSVHLKSINMVVTGIIRYLVRQKQIDFLKGGLTVG